MRWQRRLAAAAPRLVRWFPELALRLASLEPQSLGRLGEAVAARHLSRAGLRIHARRVELLGVEVDLLARDGSRWVLVEVKSGSSKRLDALGESGQRPGRRFDVGQARRLRRAASGLQRVPGAERPRIDLVEVWIFGRQRRVEVAWEQDAQPR